MKGKLSSIRFKTLAVFLLIALIPLIALGFFVNYLMSNTIEDQFENATSQEIQQVDQGIELFFDVVKQNTNMLATNETVMQADDSIESYVDTDEPQQLNSSTSGGIEQEIFEIYEHYAETHPEIRYAYLATTDGGYIQYPEGEVTAGYDPSERPYYTQAMENPDEVTLTDAYYWEADDEVIISSVIPIQNQQGDTIGVQGADVSLGGLTSIIEDVEIGETGYVVLVEDTGTVLSNPNDSSMSFQNVSELGIEEVSDINNINDTFFETSIDGVNHYVNTYTSESSGWTYLAVVESSELMGQIDSVNTTLIIVTVIIAVIVVIIAYVYAKRLTNPIYAMNDQLAEMSDGDFTSDVPEHLTKRSDEFGLLANQMKTMKGDVRGLVETIHDVTNSISQSSHTLSNNTKESSTAANEVATSVQEVADGTTQQADQLETGQETVKQLSDNITEVVKENKGIDEKSSEMSQLSENGRLTIGDLINKTEQNKTATNETSSVMHQMNSFAQEISQFTKHILEITEQTNLLALNASIEASRAGEHGKGFAVVAEEIRKLAEQSSKTTEDINRLVTNIQEQSQVAVDSIKKTQSFTEENEAAVKETQRIFDGINEAVNNLAQNAKRVMSYSEDMEARKEDLSEMIQTISASGQETAASAEEISASTEEQLSSIDEMDQHASHLVGLVDQLRDEVKKFKV
ncbi:methyl-accepting chemotaxis protein [Alkalibacillus flavidus]|uniref:Methyl-accepting chemotaxis protein n=1 Tax=Alkalibacillus flavidus TaxID=546021 RepID=A0ABV2KXT4_9BACI